MHVFNDISVPNDVSYVFDTNIPERDNKPLYWLIYNICNILYKMGNELIKEILRYLFMYLCIVITLTLIFKNYFNL
jgi:hypothetical protein